MIGTPEPSSSELSPELSSSLQKLPQILVFRAIAVLHASDGG